MVAEAGGLLQVWGLLGELQANIAYEVRSCLKTAIKLKKKSFSSWRPDIWNQSSWAKWRYLSGAHPCERLKSESIAWVFQIFVMLGLLVCNHISWLCRQMSSFLIKFSSVLFLDREKIPLYLGPNQGSLLWTKIPRNKPCLQRLTN